MGVVAGVAGLIQLSSYATAIAKPVGIYGRCMEKKVSTDPKTKAVTTTELPCENTYVDFKNERSEKSVKRNFVHPTF